MGEYPPAILVERLATARREGASFAEAWAPALADALAGVPQRWEREAWSHALAGTWRAWRASYERRPATRTAQTFARLLDPERCEPVPERACERCGQEIPSQRSRRALYCGAQCRYEAHRERELLAV